MGQPSMFPWGEAGQVPAQSEDCSQSCTVQSTVKQDTLTPPRRICVGTHRENLQAVADTKVKTVDP